MTTPIETFLHRKVVVLDMDAPVREAAHAMCRREVGCVVVSGRAGAIVGIVTDRDVTCAVATSLQALESPLSDAMTPEPVTVSEEGSVEEAIRLMEDAGVRRIPVVRRHQGREHCVGIVTLDDLIATERIEPKRLSRIVQSQIRRRILTPWSPGRTEKAEARSEARQEQSLNRFYSRLDRRTQLGKELLVPVTLFLLESLVKRLHYTAASGLVAQLPHVLQESLLDLPAGPDRGITAETLLHGLQARCGLEREHAIRTLHSWFPAFGELISEGELRNLRTLLPEDIVALFGPAGNGAATPERRSA